MVNEVVKKAQLAKTAAQTLLSLNNRQKNLVLKKMAGALLVNSTVIIAANKKDLDRGIKGGMSKTLLDRLELNEARIKAMAAGILNLTKLPDPIGKTLMKTKRPNGLKIKKVSVPMGLIGIIYESRPNVTADAAALCFKAGSAVILRGGSDAIESNKVIVATLRNAIKQAGLNEDILQLITATDRKLVSTLLTLKEYIDLIIPRGGAGLIERVVNEATIPVIETGTGNCHIYVEKTASLKKAVKIIMNAKTQRPSVCNALEKILIDKEIAPLLLPDLIKKLKEAGVVIHGCPQTKKYDKTIITAKESDWPKEYLTLEIAIKIVASAEEAIAHINKYNSKHTDAILSKNKKIIKNFQREVDASSVIANASTRFTDGGEFGFGCEIGISTQKLHARGPMGLPEITSYKYLVNGRGQTRK